MKVPFIRAKTRFMDTRTFLSACLLLTLTAGCIAELEYEDVPVDDAREVDGSEPAAAAEIEKSHYNVTTGALCGWGVSDCNKCVNNVESTFASANASSASHLHGRLGTRKSQFRTNKLNHNQGIGRLYHPDGRYFVLSRSMEGKGQLLMFRMSGYNSKQGQLGSGASHSTSNTVVWQFNDVYDRNHPDGLSVMGRYFVHGISCEGGDKCNRAQNMPRVYVWNAVTPTSPARTLNFDLVNWLGDVPNQTSSAGASTMVKLSNGRYMIIFKSRHTNKGRVVRFIQGTSLTNRNTWSQVTVLDEDLIPLWDDDEFNYQHISAITECGTGAIYLIATKGDEWGGCDSNDSEVARLYKLEGGPGLSYSLSLKTHQYFRCADAVAFGGAAGVYVSSKGKLNFYTSEKTYHEVGSGVKVKFREFWTP